MAKCEAKENVVVVCIGSEKIAGDSLAPLVGDELRERYAVKNFVYGTTDESINGRNYDEWLEFILKVHKGAKILAVDAGLGAVASVGKIRLTAGVVPKKAVTGGGKAVGDAGIVGIVGEVSDNPLGALLTVSADEVQNMAEKIAFVIFSALYAF